VTHESDDAAQLPRTAAPAEALRAALDALASGRVVAVATVLSRRGSSPSTPGQKLTLSAEDGARGHAALAVGTVGGGAVERAVIAEMKTALRGGSIEPRVHTFRLGASLGMCCGGSADILIEVLRPGIAVLLVGAGHVGLATAEALAALDFAVTLVDARPAATEPERVTDVAARGVAIVTADHDDPEVLAALAAPPRASACVVMTHDHQLDQRAIEWALRTGFAFVGGVGSRAKAERTSQRLAARGFSPEDRERVRMPVGLDIGARRPREIAVAIAAELVRFRARAEGLVRHRPSAEEEVDDAQPSSDRLPALAAVERSGRSSAGEAATETELERST
jgi:xanthine dehydrogenase accessory factor